MRSTLRPTLQMGTELSPTCSLAICTPSGVLVGIGLSQWSSPALRLHVVVTVRATPVRVRHGNPSAPVIFLKGQTSVPLWVPKTHPYGLTCGFGPRHSRLEAPNRQADISPVNIGSANSRYDRVSGSHTFRSRFGHGQSFVGSLVVGVYVLLCMTHGS